MYKKFLKGKLQQLIKKSVIIDKEKLEIMVNDSIILAKI